MLQSKSVIYSVRKLKQLLKLQRVKLEAFKQHLLQLQTCKFSFGSIAFTEVSSS